MRPLQDPLGNIPNIKLRLETSAALKTSGRPLPDRRRQRQRSSGRGVAGLRDPATSHNVTVRTTDQGGLTFDQSFTIAVTNVNEAPSITVENDGPAEV